MTWEVKNMNYINNEDDYTITHTNASKTELNGATIIIFMRKGKRP